MKTMPKKPHNANTIITAEIKDDLLNYLKDKPAGNKVGDFPITYFKSKGWNITEWVNNIQKDKTVKGEPGRVATGLLALIKQNKYVEGITTFKECGTRNSAAHLTKNDLDTIQQTVIEAAFNTGSVLLRNARTRAGVISVAHKELPDTDLTAEALLIIETRKKVESDNMEKRVKGKK